VPRVDQGPCRRAAERDPVPRAPEWASGERRNASGSHGPAFRRALTLNAGRTTRPGSPDCTPRDRPALDTARVNTA
jgi:hypothetical protein